MTAAAVVPLGLAVMLTVVAALAESYRRHADTDCGGYDDLPALDRQRHIVAALRRATRTETP